MKPIVFTGGGTGGHIYPGLAIADELKAISNDYSIIWIGSNNGKDKKMVEANVSKTGVKTANRFIAIPSGKLRRYASFQNFIDIFKIGFGFIASVCILLKVKPLLVFSKGGFVSVPPCAAAKLLGIPVFTHECDFSPGLATKLNMRFANKILLSYEESKKFFNAASQPKLVVTGNPVRDVFFHTDSSIGFTFLELQKSKKPILMVLGGSSGAKQVNNVVFENIEWLSEQFDIVHQTGAGEGYKRALEVKASLPTDESIVYKPFDFIYSEMPHVLSCADIILSRSGANSIWECAVEQKPMLLLPLAGSGTRGDQVENAKHFQDKGGAVVVDSLEKDFDVLSGNITSALSIMKNEDSLQSMKNVLKEMTQTNPAKTIAGLLIQEIGY